MRITTGVAEWNVGRDPPNGDCSVVLARNKADAIEKLDEAANAEGCPMIELSEAQVHFALTDDGQLVLDGVGDDTEAAIFEFCCPVLSKTLAAWSARCSGSATG